MLLALDQGTTSSRAILFTDRGEVAAVAQREVTQIYPRAGWVEHDAEEILASQLAVMREAVEAAGSRPIAAVGITNQRETTVVWDRSTGRPIHHAIVWQDRRTAPACERLKAAGHEAMVRDRCGLVFDPYFSAAKIAWILDHVPGARIRAQRGELAFGTVDSWLTWHLTGGITHVTDASNASRTSLFNLHTGDWDDEMLALFDVPRAVLPTVVPSSGVVGYVDAGLPGGGLPISGLAGDQQAALFGQACFEPGQVKNTYGTGCFLLMNTGSTPATSHHGLLTTVAWRLGDRLTYALEGSVFIAGAAVQWLRDGLGFFEHSGDIEALAASVPDTDGVYFVPAFVGLGAPHWDPHARGTIVGITPGTTRAHLARAALESMAFQTLDVTEAMARDAGASRVELRVDGGASANDLLLQIQADVLQAAVVRPAVTETTALGAAMLAGLGVGLYTGLEQIAESWAAERRFRPQADALEVSRRVSDWRRAVGRSRDWVTE